MFSSKLFGKNHAKVSLDTFARRYRREKYPWIVFPVVFDKKKLFSLVKVPFFSHRISYLFPPPFFVPKYFLTATFLTASKKYPWILLPAKTIFSQKQPKKVSMDTFPVCNVERKYPWRFLHEFFQEVLTKTLFFFRLCQ